MSVELGVAVAASSLWVALAMPGLQLVSGVGGGADPSVAISLQSALLGIDDGRGSQLSASDRAAWRALGLDPSHASLPGSLLLARNGTLSASLVAQLDSGIALPLDVAPPSGVPSPPMAATAPTDGGPTFVSAVSSQPLVHAVRPSKAPPVRKPPPDSAPPAATPPPAAATPAPPELLQQTIVFTTTPPRDAVAGSPAYLVAATAGSGLPVVFSADASSAGVCTVSGSRVDPIGPGTCVVDANQAGNARYRTAPQVQQSFVVQSPVLSLSIQTITFTSSAPAGAVIGGTPYSLAATASSGLPVSFSLSPGSAGVCALTGHAVSFLGAGTCRVFADQSGGGGYAAAARVQQSFAVGRVPQTIVFTSTPPSGAVVGGPAYTVAASASSGLPVVFSAEASSAAVCTVSGSSVLAVGPGTCLIEANQFGSSTYQGAVVEQSFTVGAAAASQSVQSIQIASTPPAGAVIGGAPYTLSATASSGLPVTISVVPASAAVCSVAGATVSFVGAGTCSLAVDQPGDTSYLPAPQVQQSFSVGHVPQAISFGSAPPAGALVGDPAYTVSASATSGLPVVFSGAPSSAGVCTVSGASVTLVGAGTCTVDADQPGGGVYGAAAGVQQSFTVAAPSLSVQSIDFTSSAPSGAVVGGTSVVSATASSGLPVEFSIAAGSAGVCTLSGATVSFIGSGTCTIDADQAGNGGYAAASQVQQSFAVGLSGQVISFTSAPPAGANVGDPAYTVSATATSGLTVTFSADASSAGVCTVSGSAVSFVSLGTCTIDAAQAGDASHAAAPPAQQSFSIGGAPVASVQSITFTSAAPSGAAVGAAYTVSASASSGLPVFFTVAAAGAGVCTVSGTTVSFLGAGTCTIDANQPGNAGYQAAPQVQQSFSVGRASQTSSFTSAPPGGATVGSTYTVAATAGSGLAVAFTIAPASAGVCTLSGSVVSFVGPGTCTIRADQGGNGTYAPAPQIQQSFAVGNAAPSKSGQTIQFTSTAPAGAVVGGTYAVAASASSGLAVALTVDSTSAGVCTISGPTVTLVGAGTCRIDANQAGNSAYLAAAQLQQSFAVALRTQTISFTSTPPGGAVVGGGTYAVSASATSGLAVTFTVTAGSAGVCTVSGSTVSMAGAGTCVVTASQAGNTTYQAAVQVQQSFTVHRGSQTITFTSTPPNADKHDPPYTITATASSGLAVVFSVDASSAGICSISGSTVSFSARGTCVIYANQPGNVDWLAAPQVQQVIEVKNHTPG